MRERLASTNFQNDDHHSILYIIILIGVYPIQRISEKNDTQNSNNGNTKSNEVEPFKTPGYVS